MPKCVNVNEAALHRHTTVELSDTKNATICLKWFQKEVLVHAFHVLTLLSIKIEGIQ